MSGGITRQEFQASKQRFFDLEPVASRGELITAVAVAIEGIQGSPRRRAGDRVTYRLLIDVTTLRDTLPEIWVMEPPDERIGHVNVFPARPGLVCPLVNRPLPHLCWGTFPDQWSSAAPAQRTLATLLEDIRQHLNRVNRNSPARPDLR
jgi:hypothetical protein